ncbi:hypothetical protein IJD44_00795 [bacterium]|nr:hypothetical protein [bacterium]
MKIYLVMDAINGKDYRVFTMKNDAKNFILKQYESFLKWEKENFPEMEQVIDMEKAKVYFKEINGVEDFMYIEELTLDDFSDIEW